jgi:hypothetical protein
MSDHDHELNKTHEMDIDGDGDTEPISENDPAELAQAYVDEVAGEDGWRVEEVSGNVDFGMVTVMLGRYLPKGDMEQQVRTAEGHGTDIAAAVDAALGRSEAGN